MFGIPVKPNIWTVKKLYNTEDSKDKPRGFNLDRCPHDNNKLEKSFFEYNFFGGFWYYKCPICNYEYAMSGDK